MTTTVISSILRLVTIVIFGDFERPLRNGHYIHFYEKKQIDCYMHFYAGEQQPNLTYRMFLRDSQNVFNEIRILLTPIEKHKTRFGEKPPIIG